MNTSITKLMTILSLALGLNATSGFAEELDLESLNGIYRYDCDLIDIQSGLASTGRVITTRDCPPTKHYVPGSFQLLETKAPVNARRFHARAGEPFFSGQDVLNLDRAVLDFYQLNGQIVLRVSYGGNRYTLFTRIETE